MKYMKLLETAPPLKAESLADGYRVLAEFNGTVLAGKKTLVTEAAGTIMKYMKLLETAPPLKAESLADGYRVLAEFNGTVLAGKKTLLGAQFVTWAWDYDRRGVSNGHYYMEDYQTAKEDFTFRSGLMAREQVFDRERLEELRQAAQGFLCGEGPASYRQEFRCQRILDQIRSQLPEPKQNQIQKEGPSIEQSM